MPELSRFYGIRISLHIPDHPPPHIHAVYGEHEATFDIDPLEISDGYMPRRARRLVIEWMAIHQAELTMAWDRLQNGQSVNRIEPLR